MDPAKRAFYQFHASLMEPWDGPASIAFTDGTVIGAVLDRNGLRPSRYWVTDDGLVVMASRGRRARHRPVRRSSRRAGSSRAACSSSTPPQGRIVDDEEIKREPRRRAPVRASGSTTASSTSTTCPTGRARRSPAHTSRGAPAADVRLHARGAASSSSRRWPAPAPRRSARWAPTRRSRCCPTGPRLLFDYFSQLFAQVTNPPLDAIREELVTSLGSTIGPEGNLLDPGPASCRQIVLPRPVLDNDELAKLRPHQRGRRRRRATSRSSIDGLYPVPAAATACATRSSRIRREVSDAIAGGAESS